jgi:hypothetical protein
MCFNMNGTDRGIKSWNRARASIASVMNIDALGYEAELHSFYFFHSRG